MRGHDRNNFRNGSDLSQVALNSKATLYEFGIPDHGVHWAWIGAGEVIEADAEVRGVENVALYQSVRIIEPEYQYSVHSSEGVATEDLKPVRSTRMLHLVCRSKILPLT